MSSKNMRLRACVCGVLASAAVSGSAYSQDKVSVLEEIVVTAERRDQSLQDVPLSITAFSDDTRDRIGILSIQDMANFAPGVSFNMATDRPSIRGIARQSNFFSLDSPVANYFDGVYTSSVQDAQRRPIFIERTEILRGPQGALSGRGSIAGAINTLSKRPRDEFGAEVRVFGGSYDRFGAEGTVTAPIADWMRFRINLGDYKQEQGYFENVATGDSEGDQPNNRTVQDYLVEFDIGDSVDLFLKASFADYDESRRTGYSGVPFVAGILGSPSAYGPSSATLTPLASYGYFAPGSVRVGTNTNNPVLLTGDEFQFSNDYKSRQTLDEHHNYNAHLTWHAPGFDVKWIGGHQNYRYTQLTDGDGTDVSTMPIPTNVAGTITRTVSPGSIAKYAEERKWYSNELTFTSTGDGAFNWIAGLYQSNEDYNQEPATTIFRGYNELNNPIGTVDRLLQLLTLPPCNPPAVTTNCYNVANAARVIVANPRANTSVVGLLDGNTKSSAAFGQVDFDLSDAWKVTLGARYNKDEKEVTESTRYIANGLGSGLGRFLAGGALGAPLSVDVTPLPTAGAPLPAGVVRDRGIDPVTGYRIRDMEGEWTAVTGSLGVDFKPTADDLIYVRASRGYRPGGFNAGFVYEAPQAEEEIVNSFEVGYKTTIASKLQLSTSVFYYDYKDIQLPLPTLGRCTTPGDLSTCTTLDSFVNLPKAESMGLELEANWQIVDDFGVYFTYGYLNAKIKDGLPEGSNGFSNTLDPAAVLRNANPYQSLGQADDFTGLTRYTQDISGNKLANSPEHRAALNANYTFQLNSGSLLLSASYVWRDEQYSDVFETEEAKVDGFSTVGARLIWTDVEDRYTVMLYGTNLTDEIAADSASATRVRTGLAGAPGAAYFHNENLLPPREYGLEVQYRFGKP